MFFRAIFLSLFSIISIANAALFPHRNTTTEGAGDIAQFVPIMTALAMTGYKKDVQGFKQLGLTTVSTLIVTEAAKKTFNHVYIDGRSMGERPNGSMDNFPSGHTSFAFSGAWYIKKRYGWKYGAAPIAIATFTGYSRIYANKHDLKGVLSGALTGILFAEIFTKTFENNKNLQVSLNTNGFNAFQVNFGYQF